MTNKIYLNTASCGLLDKASLQNTEAFYEAMLTESSTASEIVRDQRIPQIRDTVASFIKAPVSNVAFVPNFSYALNCIVQSLNGGEKILMYRHDYPSLCEPFRINHFDITWIDAADGFTINADDIKELLLQHDIDILALSHVQWLTGFKADIQELGAFCKEHDITFIVDATQSLGSLPLHLDELYADVLISSNYKWMNAGFGTGILYLSDRFMEMYLPVIGGNNSYGMHGGVWSYEPSVRSYEPGHLNLHGLLVLEAVVQQKQQQGIEGIEQHNMVLTKELLNALQEMNGPLIGPVTMGHRSSIVVVEAGEQIWQHLADNNIIVTKRDGTIRVSMHFYNTANDVQRLAECLAAAYKKH